MKENHCCFSAALWFGLVVLGCGSEPDSKQPTQTAGGVAGTSSAVGAMGGNAGRPGSASTAPTGGAAATVAGGTTAILSGGATATGAATSKGGTTSKGGAPGTGGTTSIGGTTAAAGTTSSAGAPAVGGTTSKGGTTSSGGTSAAGGTSGLGGKAGTSSTGSTGGASTAGAPPIAGGSSASGGVSTGGTSSTTCTPGTPRTGGTEYCSNTKGDTTSGYSYEVWMNEPGSGCMTVYGVDATFKATWTNASDVMSRFGLRFDGTKTYDQLGTISSDFAFTKTGSSGEVYIGIYGQSGAPLQEYYIVEDWIGSRPLNGNKISTITVDGGAYDVYKDMLSSTTGTITQFYSVRQTPRQCGHISISKHFSEWAGLGLTLGKLDSAGLLVEAFQKGTGSIDFSTATVLVN